MCVWARPFIFATHATAFAFILHCTVLTCCARPIASHVKHVSSMHRVASCNSITMGKCTMRRLTNCPSLRAVLKAVPLHIQSFLGF